MTRIGFIGLGKLGLPTCYTYAFLGHQILGYDINPERMTYQLDTIEAGLTGKGSINELFEKNDNIKNNLSFSDNLEEVIKFGDIIFVAIQTPHDKKFEGIERLTKERKDFDYTYLINSIKEISVILDKLGREKIVSIISTVLPGTIRKYIFPILSKNIKLCYNPYFIAMGTVARDLVFTEFVLLGSVDEDASRKMIEFYKTITDAPVHKTTLENAELIKVTYNTFIGTKIVLANNIMELCDKLPNTDCDDVIDALSLANRRILSSQYLRGGMGDGGGCLPPGELVMTENGMKPIETIKVGDNVLSHNGVLRKVNKVYERDYEGDLIEVNVMGQPPIKVTSDHPMLVCEDDRKLYSSGKRDTRYSISEKLSNMEEKNAEKLIANQHYIPSYKSNINNMEYIKNIPEHVTEDYCDLAGWYLSEGSLDGDGIRNYRINIALHAKEKNVAEHLSEVFKRISPPKETGRGAGAVTSIVVEGNNCNLRYGCLDLGRQLFNDFGKGSLEKFLPDWVLFGPSWIAKQIIRGMWQGDGHSSIQGGMTYSTISPNLAYGVQHILTRFGIPSTLRDIPERIGKDGLKHKRAYEVRVRNALYFDEMEKLTGKKRPEYKDQKLYNIFPFKDEIFYRKVTSTKNIPYKGKVHNIWVDVDHTYVTKIGAVHNCHPRDNIALSWLSDKLDLTVNFFDMIMTAREKQTEYFSRLIIKYHLKNKDLPIYLLGKSFKANTAIMTGSPAILLKNILDEMEINLEDWYDPLVDERKLEMKKGIYCLAVSHDIFKDYKFPKDSIVIDPFRYITQKDIILHSIGSLNK